MPLYISTKGAKDGKCPGREYLPGQRREEMNAEAYFFSSLLFFEPMRVYTMNTPSRPNAMP